MRNRFFIIAALAVAPVALADVQVLIDGVQRPEYVHRGATYIEAARGREYSIRIQNPTPHRVAVALAVDGLNSIDGKHTDAWGASKWVLEPYGSAVIDGWQVSDSTARRFFFTGETGSYAAKRGQTANLGVIEAVFFRERETIRPYSHAPRRERERDAAAAEQKAPADDEYAATGMGDRTRHDVTNVDIDLERTPFTTVRIRYEFRPELVRLGVLSKRDPLERREKARGFEYCPEP